MTRQLQYSKFNPKLTLDICIFLNGLPIMTFEFKNQLTKQNVYDAVEQYKNDRSPAEVLFSFKRCMVHFAVDDNEVRMCTELKGKKSWFGHKPAKGCKFGIISEMLKDGIKIYG